MKLFVDPTGRRNWFRTFSPIFCCFCCFCLIFRLSDSFAQGSRSAQDLGLRPIYVTTRLFQMRTPRGRSPEITDQLFKMRTASLTDHDKWINTLKKTYPGLEAALLRTETRRVFRTANQTVVTVAKRPDGRSIEIRTTGAQSPGDGETPGTSLIPEIGLHFGNDSVRKPITYSLQNIEVESGMTYFYAVPDMKMNPADYVNFFRPTTPVEPFNDSEIHFVFAYSVDLDKTAEPVRYFDERQSRQLQEKATKTAQPAIPAALQGTGLGGLIRVRIEISTEGKVTGANIHYSSFPEINNEALAAARQWEFPSTLFAENRNPITGFIVFNLMAKR